METVERNSSDWGSGKGNCKDPKQLSEKLKARSVTFESGNARYFDLTLDLMTGRNSRSLAFVRHSAFTCLVKKVTKTITVTSAMKTTMVMTITTTNGQQAPPPVVSTAAGVGLAATGVGAVAYSLMGGGAGALRAGYPIGASSIRRVTRTRRSMARGSW